MKTWKPLLVLLLALAATELVSSEQESYDVVREDDDGEGDFDQIVTDAAKKVCETFSDDGAKRSVLLEKRRRGWLKKAWKEIKPVAKKILDALWKRDLEETSTVHVQRRGWFKKVWKKVKPYVPIVIKIGSALLGKKDLSEVSNLDMRRELADISQLRREDGDGCQDPETAEMVEAVGTLAAVTDMMASAEGCDADA